jgi:pimeloyl-ACP methyl ester carboxylesterase
MLLRNPLIYGQICMLQTPGPRPASVDLLRKAVFSKSMPRNQALGFLGRMQDEPISVALELMWPFVPKRHDTPLLVLGAEEDYFVSPALVRATAASYGTQADILPGIGHAMMLDTRWEEAAKRIQRWLETSAATA